MIKNERIIIRKLKNWHANFNFTQRGKKPSRAWHHEFLPQGRFIYNRTPAYCPQLIQHFPTPNPKTTALPKLPQFPAPHPATPIHSTRLPSPINPMPPESPLPSPGSSATLSCATSPASVRPLATVRRWSSLTSGSGREFLSQTCTCRILGGRLRFLLHRVKLAPSPIHCAKDKEAFLLLSLT